MSPADWVNIGAGIVLIASGLAAWHVKGKAWFRTHSAARRARDFSLSGGPIIDPQTGRTIRVQPSLGEWMWQQGQGLAEVKAEIVDMKQLIAGQVRQDNRLDSHDQRFAEHESRISALEQ